MLERLITRVTMSRDKSRWRQDRGYFDACLRTSFVVVRARVRVENVRMAYSRETSIYALGGRLVYFLERQILVALGL